MAVNKVILIGNVGADPEVRYVDKADRNNNNKVASVRLATSERYKDREGNIKEQTEWHNLVCWGKTAEVIEKYVHKGTPIYVEGSLRSRSYSAKDGQTRYVTEVRVDSLQLLGGRREEANTAPAQSNTPVLPADLKESKADDGDLPF